MKNKNNGFTLIELILYIAIVSILISTLISFAWNVIGSGTKSSVQQEVFTQARYISERLKYEIRNSINIDSISTASITLSTDNFATDPTVINLSSGNLQITQGSSSPVNLNSSLTSISDIVFTDFSSDDNNTKNIQFKFTVNSNYGSALQEYILSTSIEGSAEVRSN